METLYYFLSVQSQNLCLHGRTVFKKCTMLQTDFVESCLCSIIITLPTHRYISLDSANTMDILLTEILFFCIIMTNMCMIHHFTHFTFRFGSCEQYEQASDLCNTYFNETDYVYIKNRMTQSQIATALSRIPTSVSATAECRDNVLRIICHRFFAPCGTNGTIYLPTSICREECSYVRDTCQTFWSQAFEAIESELGRVNCETPGSALSPLPSCCTGAGVSIPSTSE